MRYGGVNLKGETMAERKVDVSGSGLGSTVGMLIAAIVLLTVLFSLGVFDLK